ncbi:MAG TPA: tetratricopeptide repeat protein [Opitutaceae bacterium]|jgi:HemY protein
MKARHPRALLASIALALIAVGVDRYAIHRTYERAAAAAATAVPSVPDLSTWPAAYAARVRAATAVALHGGRPFEALQELARLYHANSAYEQAERLERSLAAIQPKNPRWPLYLADAAQNLGDMEASRAFLEQTVRLSPHYAAARLKLADACFKAGDLDEASRQYQARIDLVPDDPYARLGLARIALQREDRDGARRYLEAAVRRDPNFVSAHNLLAEVYDQLGRRADAEEQRSAALGRFVEADDPWMTELYAWTFDPFRLVLPGVAALQTRQFSDVLPFYRAAARDGTNLSASIALAALKHSVQAASTDP